MAAAKDPAGVARILAAHDAALARMTEVLTRSHEPEALFAPLGEVLGWLYALTQSVGTQLPPGLAHARHRVLHGDSVIVAGVRVVQSSTSESVVYGETVRTTSRVGRFEWASLPPPRKERYRRDWEDYQAHVVGQSLQGVLRRARDAALGPDSSQESGPPPA